MALDPEAVYNQTAADVALQAGWEEGSLNEQEGSLKANEAYQESQITSAEPGMYRGESNASNRGGLLTSGINAHRKEGIATTFAARRTANKLAETEGLARIKSEREGGVLKRTESLHNAASRRAEALSARAAEAAYAPSAASPYVGGVVPSFKENQPPGTWVRIGGRKK